MGMNKGLRVSSQCVNHSSIIQRTYRTIRWIQLCWIKLLHRCTRWSRCTWILGNPSVRVPFENSISFSIQQNNKLVVKFESQQFERNSSPEISAASFVQLKTFPKITPFHTRVVNFKSHSSYNPFEPNQMWEIEAFWMSFHFSLTTVHSNCNRKRSIFHCILNKGKNKNKMCSQYTIPCMNFSYFSPSTIFSSVQEFNSSWKIE